MPEKFTAFIKKYYPVFLFLLIMLMFLFLSEASDADAETPYISHTFIVETYLAETETESDTEADTIPESSENIETETEISKEIIETEEPETGTEPSETNESVLLEDVPYYSQEYILPTGCEIVSAKMLLSYYTHEEPDIQEMISFLNCEYPVEIDGYTYAHHPEDAFVGNPETDHSFGCFAPIITEVLNQFLPDGLQAEDISGTELREIAETYLPQGKPVLVWATIGMWESFPNAGWYLLDKDGNPTNEWYDWLANEHCMVLVGYDDDYYYFNDPYDSHGLISFGREKTEKRYEEIGKYAVVVTESEN